MIFWILCLIVLIVLMPIAFSGGQWLRRKADAQTETVATANHEVLIAELENRISDDSEGVLQTLIEIVDKAPPTQDIIEFIRKHYSQSGQTKLALSLLSHSETRRLSFASTAVAVDYGSQVRERLYSLSASGLRMRFFSLNDYWKLDALTFDQAVQDFHAAGHMAIPTDAQIQEVKDDWVFEEIKAPTGSGNGSMLFSRLVLEQPWTIYFEAYKPGKYVSYEELVRFVFENLEPVCEVKDFKAHYGEARELKSLNWSVNGQAYCLNYNRGDIGLDVEWLVEELNRFLAESNTGFCCHFGHYLEGHVILFVAQTDGLFSLLVKYHLLDSY